MRGNPVVLLFSAAWLSTAFSSEADVSGGPKLLKLPLRRHRKLPNNFTFSSTNEVLLELHNNHNWSYSSEVTVGNPPQRLRLEFDTGSSDLWVASSAVCRVNPTYCKTHRTYNHTESTTYTSVEGQLHIPYGSETIDVNIAIEDFFVNGLKIKHQYFGEAYKIENKIHKEKYPDNKDGIFGLSFQELSYIGVATGQPSPLMSMMLQGLLPQPVFTFYFTHPQSQHAGELVLGGVDPKLYTGDFVFADVIADKSWSIRVDGLFVGDKQIGKDFDAVVDSGTTLITGPGNLINPIRDGIFKPDSTKSSIPCNFASKLKDVTFVISGEKFVLTPSDYIVKEYSNVTCLFGFHPSRHTRHSMVLGDVFMRRFYTLFDLGRRRIGFATANEKAGS